MAEALVNSSDIEADSDPEVSNLGGKLIDKFMQGIQTDRVATIKFQKGLKLTNLAPSTSAQHKRTWNQFSFFYQNAGGRRCFFHVLTIEIKTNTVKQHVADSTLTGRRTLSRTCCSTYQG
jgi:hypothetical protein